jgi:lipid A ethanolaminephosphotransferase
MLSSFAAYFMDTYGVMIDDGMLINALQTDMDETMGLVSIKMVMYALVLGILPSFFIYKIQLEYKSIKKELLSKLTVIGVSLLLIISLLMLFGGNYASFFREHKHIRQYTNPTFWIYSVNKVAKAMVTNRNRPLIQVGRDANISEHPRKKIFIMVVGEAARWDHFSLNGYERETNPLLKQKDIVNLSNVYSCGTSTAHSVPCMFSMKNRERFDIDDAKYEENVLDVINHTGKVAIIWRDNNSNSKGVADRLRYENYKQAENNTICDSECRDEGMLVGLDQFIQTNSDKDVLVVLHQMGNHGPEYYKRYTDEFKKFTPVCETNQLEECTDEEITNAFDNAILYTDDFLSKTIDFLNAYDSDYDVGMIYMSDHGESLGENGIYLHGIPYVFAPEAQIHIGAFMWFGKNTQKHIPYKKIAQNAQKEYSQDNLSHTLLGFFKVETNVYKKEKDMINVTQ